MKYDVHLYHEVRVGVKGVEAENPRAAIEAACVQYDFGLVGESIEPVDAVVDPILPGGEPDLDNSEYINLREPTFTPAEMGAILAGLRMWRAEGSSTQADDAMVALATQDSTVTALTPDEIDALCERINLGEV